MAINELQVIDSTNYLAMPMVTVEQAAMMYTRLREITKKVLKQDIDFGIIPGTGNKPSLYKSGAENLLRFYGLGHKIVSVEKNEDWENGFFEYNYRVRVIKTLTDGTEITLSECDGSANVREPKFYKKKNGEIRNPYEQVNSLKKMALKRALVGATLQATGGSGLFTQDIEDMEFDDDGNHTPQHAQRSQQQSRPQQPRPSQNASQTPSNNSMASDKQRNAIVALGKKHGLEGSALNGFISGQTGKEQVDKLTVSEASAVIGALNHYQSDAPVTQPPREDGPNEPNGQGTLDIDDIPDFD